MSDTIIKLTNVTKTYKLYPNPRARLKEALHPFGKKYHNPFHALSDINLEVKKGEILGIVGRNGSGKSTLLKIISGVLPATSGIVNVKGRVSALLELGSGFNPNFTGLENIYFMGSLQGFSKEEMKKKVEDIVDFAEIGEHIDQPVRTYSSGMKSRLAFAVNTAIEPEILILDEVLSVGDVLFRHKAYARMESLIKNEHVTVLFVSHSEQDVIKLCKNSILLEKGKAVAKGASNDVFFEYKKRLFGKNITNNKQNDRNSVNDNQSTDSYLPTLLSKKSKIVVDTGEVAITDVYFIDNNNKKYNQLRTGQRYTLVIYIETEIVKDIRFSIVIKDDKGLKLAGFNHRMLSELDNVKLHNGVSVLEVEYMNGFRSGFYYISTGISNSDQDWLYVINDGFVFEVQSDYKNEPGYFRVFDFNYRIKEYNQTSGIEIS